METPASTRLLGKTTFFCHHAITARTGASILTAVPNLDDHPFVRPCAIAVVASMEGIGWRGGISEAAAGENPSWVTGIN